jgi:thioredoxin 1
MAQANFNDIINSETPVIVDFFAEWCGPCKAQTPILQQVKNELGENVKIVKIDVDKNAALANNYQVQSIPTIMIFQNGEMKWRKTGVASLTELADKVKAFS